MKKGSVLLQNAVILTGEKLEECKDQSILIEDGKIKRISPSISDGDAEKRIDLSGLTVMPGMIDCHVHPFLADANIGRLSQIPQTLMTARASNILNGMINRGFTSVRDAAGGDWGIKQAVCEGEIIGPRMFIAGRAISQTGGHGDFRSRTEENLSLCSCKHALGMTSTIADGADQIRKAVREQFRKGADQIKIMVSGGASSPNDPLERDQFSFEEVKVAVEEAKRRGSYVMAHAYGASAIKMALKAGVKSIEHGNLIDREAADLAAKMGAFVIPTLVTYQALEASAVKSGWSDVMLDKLKRVQEFGFKSVEICMAAGVSLGFGTDLLGDDFDRQTEEFLLRGQCQSNRDVLISATTTNAKLLVGYEDRVGQISEGYTADLIAINGNPLQDLSVLASAADQISLIMKEGEIVKWNDSSSGKPPIIMK